MPLSKYPIEVSLGGAVDEGDVEELVQPPRMREARDCSSLKGGAYTKRDRTQFDGFVDPATTGAAHSNNALVTVSTTTVRVYPDEPSSPTSESNPAPFTGQEATAFEPTEADAVKEHGDSATLVIDGVPRTLCAWNVDPSGSYTWTGLGDNVDPRQAPLLPPSLASDAAARPYRDTWWTYLATGPARYAVFDGDRQVGRERTFATPEAFTGAFFDEDTQSPGPVCFPRVRSFDTPNLRGFITCAAISTPQEPKLRYPELPPTVLDPQGWKEYPYGVRLSTRARDSLSYFGPVGSEPCAARDIMASAFPYTSPPAVPYMPDYVQPGFCITQHDEDGVVVGDPIRGDITMAQGNFLRMPGPALDMVVREDPLTGLVDVYTLHVNYNMDRQTAPAPPPLSAFNTSDNMVRICRWRPSALGITFVGELYFNEPLAPPASYTNRIPDFLGIDDSGLYDWPAGLHDTGSELMLTFSSTRYGLVPYALNPLGLVWKDPFWAPGDLTRLKIGRQNGQRTTQIYVTEQGDWWNRGDAFERRCTAADTLSGDPWERRQTTQMARGVWAGSFLTQPDENGRRWLGVQSISDQYNVAANTGPGDLQDPENFGHPWVRVTTPQAVSGSILHTLLDENLDPLPFDEAAGCIPGAAIASQGLYVESLGHCVSIHACAPGDDRTGAQEIGSQTQNDVFSATNFLVTRRELAEPLDEAQRRQAPIARVPTGALGVAEFPGRAAYPANCPYNTAVAVVQVLPFGQAQGTYMNNPYQLRVNLREDADGVIRWTAHQRYGITDAYGSGSLQSVEDPAAQLKPVASSSSSAPYEIALVVEPRLPQLVSHGGHVTVAGAAPMVTGGPQGFLAGIALQAVCDNIQGFIINPDSPFTGQDVPSQYIETDAFNSADVTRPIPDPDEDVVPDALPVASFLSVYDELGAEHRTVPFNISLALGYTVDNNGNPPVPDFGPFKDVSLLGVVLYGIPWQIAGISLSDVGVVHFFQGNEDRGVAPASRATAHIPFVSHANATLLGPTEPSTDLAITSPPSPSQLPTPLDYRAGSFPGTGAVVYTWSGELAADAPDPSRALASGGNRLWSVSSVDPRKVQYTKVMRSGYAPEWNQNLFIRVPSSPDDLTAVGSLPDGRILFFSGASVHYTYGQGPSDTGQGAGFAEPAALSMDLGTKERLSVVSGDFGCMFRSDRGFYLIDRGLNLTYVGLPYEDSTGDDARVMGTAIDSLRSEVLFYTDRDIGEDGAEAWVFNTLRNQWSTFVTKPAQTVTERNGRPYWINSGGTGPFGTARYLMGQEPTPIVEEDGVGLMTLTTGWLPMGKIQGYGRTWEMQVSGEAERRFAGFSVSGLRVELLYDYEDAVAETFDFDEPADSVTGEIKLRFRPRKQKSEAIAVRFTEYIPPGGDAADCTGWRLGMLTLLVGVKAGLDKIAITPRSS